MLSSNASSRAEPAATKQVVPDAAAAGQQAGESDTRLVRLDMSELPAPTRSEVQQSIQSSEQARSFDDFYGYALAQASLDPLEAPMRSALLENPGSLEPVRQICGGRTPVVLIDLDPHGGIFDPAAAGRGSNPLAEVLAVLRSRKIAVAWISELTDEAAPAIQARLAAERLDPARADQLLLVSDDAASKQALRRELAETHCPIAIAGDTREDFDELFAYLKNPDAAFTLNEMFGAGWFLTPNPID